MSNETIQVLQFNLGDEKYCLEVSKISEITETEQLTNIPNSAPEIEGVMDLRGETTSIVNPKILFDVGGYSVENQRIIILNSTNKGWIVDDVNDISKINRDNVDTTITENQNYINGIIDIDDEFFIWVNP